MKKYFAEGICTALLILIGSWSASIIAESIGVIGIAVSFGATFILCFYTLGKISGCHLNPIVSFAAYLTSRLSIKEFWLYVLSQCVGAIVGAVLFTVLLFMSPVASEVIAKAQWMNAFGEFSQSGISVWAAMIVEIIITFIFVFVFLRFQFTKEHIKYNGLVIGLSYTMLVVFAFELTGACMNPARCLATSFVGMLTNGYAYIIQFPIFLLAAFIGGLLAVICYRKFFADDCGNLRISWLNFK